MGHKLERIWESKRLLWVVAAVFAAAITFQYFEFPDGDVASPLFSSARAQPPVPETSSDQTPGSSGANSTSYDASNQTEPPSPAAPSTPPTTVDASATVASSSSLNSNHSKAYIDAPNAVVLVSADNSSVTVVQPVKKARKRHVGANNVVTISEMHNILLRNHASVRSLAYMQVVPYIALVATSYLIN